MNANAPAETSTGPAPVETTEWPAERAHIVSTPDTCGGKPRVAGSRIQVKHLAIMHEQQKMSPEDIVSEFPHLTLADVYAALAYYHDHREAINAEIAADERWYHEQKAKQPPSRFQEAIKARKLNAAANDPVSPG